MNKKDLSTTDQILDLLLDALLERQQARQRDEEGGQLAEPVEMPAELGIERPFSTSHVEEAIAALVEKEPAEETIPAQTPLELKDAAGIQEEDEVVQDGEETADLKPEPLPTIHLEKMLGRLCVAMLLLIAVINIPFDRHGTNLAKAMPDEAALVIRDGLLLKGSGEQVYVLEENKRRWITSLDAFTYYGYRWENVHQVDDEFLQEFDEGRPIHLLQKCTSSPHVYALENEQKRWIKDIPTFQAQGYKWEEINFVTCERLRRIPDGPPIPEDAGEPPQP